jgi:hypothetical protein
LRTISGGTPLSSAARAVVIRDEKIPIGGVHIRLRLLSLESAFCAFELDIGFHSRSLNLHGIAIKRQTHT